MRGTPVRRAVSRIRATKKRSFTTATTRAPETVSREAVEPPESSCSPELIVLLAKAEPVAVPLGDVREGGQATHPVEVHRAEQMIRVVLDHPREEVLGHEVYPLGLPVIAREPDRGVARHPAPHVGHGQAAFPAL